MHPSSQQTRSGRNITLPQWRREDEGLSQTQPVPAACGRTEILDDLSGGDVDSQNGAVDISATGDAAAGVVAAGDAAEGGVIGAEEAIGEAEDMILNAQWGQMKGTEIRDSVMNAYCVVTKWRRNIFYLPTGKAGQKFIEELTKIINQFTTDSSFASVSLMMVTIIFPLLLQKPSPKRFSSSTMYWQPSVRRSRYLP